MWLRKRLLWLVTLDWGNWSACTDDNKISIDGPTALSFTEDVGKGSQLTGGTFNA